MLDDSNYSENVLLCAAGTCETDNESDESDLIECSDWITHTIDLDDNTDVDLTKTTIQRCLADWSSKYNVTHAALSDLLCILQPAHPDLP